MDQVRYALLATLGNMIWLFFRQLFLVFHHSQILKYLQPWHLLLKQPHNCCMLVPGLRETTAALTLSHSLKKKQYQKGTHNITHGNTCYLWADKKVERKQTIAPLIKGRSQMTNVHKTNEFFSNW